jgi:hypothetical protein
MQRRTKGLLFFFATIFSLALSGQGLDDAYRYSRQQFYGTSRFNSMAGAFNALGGDIGANHLNPASIGVFKKSEMSFTLGVGINTAKSNYYGTEVKASASKPNVNNMGIVFVRELDGNDWKAVNINISYTRKNDFNQTLSFSGNQSQHSFAQHLANSSQGLSPDDLSFDAYQFVEYPAYQAYIIDPIDTADWTYLGAVSPTENKQQRGDLIRSGRMSETLLGIGTNFRDRLYIGGGIHIAGIKYYEEIRFEEEPTNPSDIIRYEYVNYLDVTGTGISFSGGIIARLTDMIRWGISVQSPTYFVNDELFSTSASSEFLDNFRASYSSPEAYYRYNFNTPLRVNTGLGVVIGRKAIISAEYEYQNFKKAKFKENSTLGGYDYRIENEEIELVFRGAHSFRGGIEYRIDPIFIRAGYAFYQYPVKSTFTTVNGNKQLYSIGVGSRYKSLLFDIGYQFSFQESQYLPYNAGFNEVAIFSQNFHSISISTTLRF